MLEDTNGLALAGFAAGLPLVTIAFGLLTLQIRIRLLHGEEVAKKTEFSTVGVGLVFLILGSICLIGGFTAHYHIGPEGWQIP